MAKCITKTQERRNYILWRNSSRMNQKSGLWFFNNFPFVAFATFYRWCCCLLSNILFSIDIKHTVRWGDAAVVPVLSDLRFVIEFQSCRSDQKQQPNFMTWILLLLGEITPDIFYDSRLMIPYLITKQFGPELSFAKANLHWTALVGQIAAPPDIVLLLSHEFPQTHQKNSAPLSTYLYSSKY